MSLRFFLSGAVMILTAMSALAVPAKMGDLDEDGVPTVSDLSRILRHMDGTAPLASTSKPFADLNQDGAINKLDLDELVREILGTRTPENLPLCRISRISPGPLEDNVALTREVIIEFSLPLATDALLTPEKIGVVFADRQVLSRVELSFDRKKVSLFPLENLPSSARIQVMLDTSGLNDILGRPVDGNANGVGGGVFASSFSTGTVTPVAGTSLTGVVYASERATGGADVPLAGVTIAVNGAEETLRAVTNAQGRFTLMPCPAGRFFVTIDGRTSPSSQFPSGNYYPLVGKKWDALAGRTDNLSGNREDTSRGTIYLPLIKSGSLKPVSATVETVVALPPSLLAQHPEWASVELRVPANSLFSDNGARGGFVGIAPVAPDRLPSPLPLGLNMPLVLTIQTDGPTNFDRPVPVCFPNLPDPVTGKKPGPGEKSALWSFNHDTGEWEVVGPMTVSADGLTVKTDAGVGVRQPGWHGPSPGSPAAGGPPAAGGDGPGSPPLPPADPNVPQPQPAPPPPPAPAEPPEPCKGTAATYVPLIYDGGKKALECAAEFGKIKEGLRCLSAALSIVGEAAKYAATLSQLKDSPAPNVQFIQAQIALVRALIGQYDELSGCVSVASPASKAQAAVVCLDAILTTINNICGVITDNSLKGKCEPSPFVKTICEGVAYAQNLVATARVFSEQAEGLQKKLIGAGIRLSLAAVESSLNLILTRLNGNQSPLPGASARDVTGSITLTPAEKTALSSALASLNAGINDIGQDSAAARELEIVSGDLLVEAGAIFADSAKSLSISGIPQPGSLFFAIEVAGQVLRGRSDESGAIRAILPANEVAIVKVWQPSTHQYASTPTLTAGPGQPSPINTPLFTGSAYAMPDTDGDGLPDVAEYVVGTLVNNKDSDGDGVNDQDELVQGTDPLDNKPMQTGVIAASPTSGPAVDVAAGNGLLVVAEGGYGFEIFRTQPGGRQPLRVAAFPLTNDDCLGAAANDQYAAVAASTGLIYVPSATVGTPGVRPTRVNVGGRARCVVLEAGTAFVGTQEGYLVEVDLSTGTVLSRLAIESGVDDMVSTGGILYIYRQGWSVAAVPLDVRPLAVAGSALLSGGTYSGRRNRLTAAGPVLYAQHAKGWHIVSLANPTQPAVLENYNTAQFGWHHVVPNGSGLGLVIVGPNAAYDAPHDVGLYNLGTDGLSHTAIAFLGLNLHGEALAIFNAQAYLAAGTAGLQVINYRAFEQAGTAPTIALTANVPLTGGSMEEGGTLRLFAAVTDDVQVRSVEFLIDGVQTSLDGAFPFETALTAPARRAAKTSFTIQAIARDTGGHKTTTPLYTVQLVQDATPPTMVRNTPAAESLSLKVPAVLVTFNEPMDQSSLTINSLFVEGAGPDGVFGTADDTKPGQGLYASSSTEFFVSFALPLTPGLYRLVVKPPAADVSGNPLSAAYLNQWRIASNKDSDNDGIPDDWEIRYGFNPLVADENNNGIPDGDDDTDGDGIPNRIEVLLGFDPRMIDTDGNGIPDGLEDSDADGLSDAAEIQYGTDPLDPDSDDDGFLDEAEVTGGSNPLLASSVPWFRPGATVGRDVKNILRLATTGAEMAFGSARSVQELGVLKLNTTGAAFPLGGLKSNQPPVDIFRLDDPVNGKHPTGAIIAKPPLKLDTRP